MRLPFPDTGVPSLELATTAVQAVLDAATRGQNVVIHCKGGLGRTGLIAACALVATGISAAEAMVAVRNARQGAIENSRQEAFVREFASLGFRFGPARAASAGVAKPHDRLRISAQQLMSSHPPRWHDANKQLVFGISSPTGCAHGGHLDYSRWGAMPLPSGVSASAAAMKVRHHPGYYEYGPPAQGAVEWHVNFADPDLFGFYAGSLFAQDEMQVVEHPALGALREALLARRMTALTKDGGQPTPVVVMGVERRCRVDTVPDRAAGRPHGLYGPAFARGSADAVRRATTRLEPPTVTNLIAIAAPRPGSGSYSRATIENVLVTAFTGFRAAVLESKRVAGAGVEPTVIVHTGWWGCGAFGGNRVLMAALQLLAAEMAGVAEVSFHSGVPPDQAALDEAVALLKEWPGATRDVGTIALIDRLTAMEFPWGVSNGT